jgi:peroxisomal membrane protein 2
MLLPLPLLLALQVWSVVSLINYRFVPLQFRVLFANIVALFW